MLSLYVFPNFKYLSKYFTQIYRAQYEDAMLVYLRGTTQELLNVEKMYDRDFATRKNIR